MSVEHLEAHILTQFQFLQQGDAVENLTIEAPVDKQRDVAVIEELHVAEHVERPAVELHEVGEVRLWGEEHGEWHLVPLSATFQIGFDATAGTRQPELLEDRCFRHVVVILTSQEAIHTHRVLQREDRRIVVDGQTLLLTVDEGLTRCISEADLDVRSLDVRQNHAIGITLVDEFARWSEFGVVEG